MRTMYVVKFAGLAILMISCVLEIQRDLVDGYEYFKLHHGIAMYAITQLMTNTAEMVKAKNELTNIS